ncbi:MAG: hypothetical protein EAZ35_09030 [Sphingobacteriia bacterium]|nr:MAG: hypothetical protein EAZ41_05215 [Sphingobacteriia bacterium]TAG29896.1 MAG: hypothetical protein EAZ35_09030 [Sphingobacteriia bacterium]
MKKGILLIFFTHLCVLIFAQENYAISFEKAIIQLKKSNTEDRVYKINFSANIPDSYKLTEKFHFSVQLDSVKSNLGFNECEIAFPDLHIGNLKKQNSCFLTLKKDSLPDRARKLVLKFNVSYLSPDKNLGLYKEITVEVSEHRILDSLTAYNYLAYIGTNFDLVNGIKPNHLFFATNIFLPPVANKVGVYLSLFGNRTMLRTDTTGNIRRVYRINRISDSSFMNYTEQVRLSRTSISDNLGAYFNPLIKLGSISDISNALQLYYSPSLEFVWRRTQIISSFSNAGNRDSTIQKGRFPGTLDFEATNTVYANEFAFNAGLIGFFMAHENKNISVRVHASVGYSSSFYPSDQDRVYASTKRVDDIFFSGRAWITESKTGITLQAEITNTANYSRPFYGVTLSKAIHYGDIGTALKFSK